MDDNDNYSQSRTVLTFIQCNDSVVRGTVVCLILRPSAVWSLFVLGLMLAASEPALILFTIGQTLVGVLAATLGVLFTIFVLRQTREL